MDEERFKELQQIMKVEPLIKPKPIILFCDECGDQTKVVFVVSSPLGEKDIYLCVDCYYDKPQS